MMVIDVVGIALVFVVAAVVIVANVVIARSECRTNRELLRVQREWMERMTDETRQKRRRRGRRPPWRPIASVNGSYTTLDTMTQR